MHEHRTIFSFDTGTLVSLLEIELGPLRAIEWLLDAAPICITEKVFEEAQRNVPLSDDDARRLLFDRIQPLIVRDDIRLAEAHLSRHVRDRGNSAEQAVDEGEKSAAALAMHLCWQGQRYVALATDDFKAADHIKPIFDLEQVGIVVSSYDLVCFLWSRFPGMLTDRDADTAIRDVTQRLLGERGPSEQGAGHSVPERYLKTYYQRIQVLARFIPERGAAS